jgi:hypothetical protein
VPDSVGEKRERSEDRRGRDFSRRDWDHDDDEDFQQNRRHGTRRHRSLSGWARSSRCHGGPEDCFSSSGRRRPSTPFRRRGLATGLAGRWIPKVKTKSVSFADPLISAVWPPAAMDELEGGKDVILADDWNPGDQTAQQPQLAAPTKVRVAEHVSFSDVVLSPKSIEIAYPNPVTTMSTLQLIDTTRVAAAPNSINQLLDVEPQALPHSNLNCPSVMPYSNINSELFNSSLSGGSPEPTRNNLDEFVASISEAPEPSLIRSPPISSTAVNFMVEGCPIQSAADVCVSPTPVGKRYSARLAAKKKLKFGRNRNAIVKAQEILVAKLNNSTSNQFQSSKALISNDQVDLVEQIARHFTRPLNKEQMEAIMELAMQGKEKEGNKKKGSKVTPLKAPLIEAVART